MYREFEIADEAILARPIELRGYTLLKHAPVTIIGYKTHVNPKIGYTYSILVTNPLSGEEERYENWVKQDELVAKLDEFELICKQLKLA